MNEVRHTPGPWFYADEAVRSHVLDNSDDGNEVARTHLDYYGDKVTGEMKANAEFIVRACNAHDDLTSAARFAVNDAQYYRLDENGFYSISEAAYKKLQAAILKADNQVS